jgi:hypothetical protein
VEKTQTVEAVTTQQNIVEIQQLSS